MLDLPPDAVDAIIAFIERSRMGSQARGFAREVITDVGSRLIETFLSRRGL